MDPDRKKRKKKITSSISQLFVSRERLEKWMMERDRLNFHPLNLLRRYSRETERGGEATTNSNNQTEQTVRLNRANRSQAG